MYQVGRMDRRDDYRMNRLGKLRNCPNLTLTRRGKQNEKLDKGCSNLELSSV